MFSTQSNQYNQSEAERLSDTFCAGSGELRTYIIVYKLSYELNPDENTATQKPFKGTGHYWKLLKVITIKKMSNDELLVV